MKVSLYCKSAMSLNAKIGAYAYIFVCGTEVHKCSRKFKNRVYTPTHADCAAFANSIHYLLSMEVSSFITELDVITDSGKVQALIETYKSDKYCHDIAKYWRENGLKSFPKIHSMKVTKIDGSKVVAGNTNSFYNSQCNALAKGELQKMLDLIK